MTSTVFYTKQGRRYVPALQYDSDLVDALPPGAHLIMVSPGIRSTRYNVNPAHASVLAAAHRMREPMIEALRKASRLQLDRHRKLNVEQQAAWLAFTQAMGEGSNLVHSNSLTGIVDAGIAVLEEAAATSVSDALSAEDWIRLRDWMADPKRGPAATQFTAGAMRDAATAFESAEAQRRAACQEKD